MKRFFDSSSSVLSPADLVCTFTGKKPEELALPKRAIVVVSGSDIRFLRKNSTAQLLDGWAPFRRVYRVEEKETVFTKSWYGGPNIATLVEELSAFGVREFCFWGYLGGVSLSLSVGDVIIASGALREEGVSHHYLDDQEDTVYSEWALEWSSLPNCKEFRTGIVWSCDAIYRETRQKLEGYRRTGVLGVEMEVASFYAVCRARGLRGAAFLVVSDLFKDDGTWVPGFSMLEFSKGTKRLGSFLREYAIV
jgi:uridine phosphorylase